MAVSSDDILAVADRGGVGRVGALDARRRGGEPLAADDNTVWGIAWSLDGTVLATASDDEVVQLWDVSTRSLLGRLTPHSGGAFAVTFLTDGATIATTSGDGSVRLWDIARARPLGGPLTGQEGSSWRGGALPPPRVAPPAEDGTVRIWDVLDPARACDRADGSIGLVP